MLPLQFVVDDQQSQKRLGSLSIVKKIPVGVVISETLFQIFIASWLFWLLTSWGLVNCWTTLWKLSGDKYSGLKGFLPLFMSSGGQATIHSLLKTQTTWVVVRIVLVMMCQSKSILSYIFAITSIIPVAKWLSNYLCSTFWDL